MTRTRLILAVAALLVAGRAEADPLACADLAGSDALVEVPAIYGFLARLAANDCLPLDQVALDALVDRGQVNLVSFVLLEAQTSLTAPPLAPEVVGSWLDAQVAASGVITPEAALTLVDMAMHGCAGDEGCVGQAMRATTAGRPVAPPASCMFGFADACPPGPAEAVPLLNSASVDVQADPQAARQRRAELICGRYLMCDGIES